MNNTTTINGLIDGISVVENNKNEQPFYKSDILYNDKEPITFNIEDIFYIKQDFQK